ncbi:YciK family oxidoreductase [Entomomonas asaccharolytica]|uniref:YciK family oxidoreductase n=1 Tax=Entomomonas asaccharolytica TaxID=2785331 RepID=A0A974NGJ5_9GAMM|nr:YciK family oxidoreductase [Entomomonas asaccharolytica]QQP86263.1 YciK family oxidoreductase [Entomomonas asaccharolytica]
MYSYTARPSLLANRTIVITGAGQGIGKALALNCAALGAKVILLARTASKLDAVSKQIIEQGYLSPIIIPFDLATAKEQDYMQLAKQLADQVNQLDGLVNNAAIAADLKPFTALSIEEFQQIMEVNVNATFALTKYLLPLLQKAPDASIIFTSSAVGRKGRALWSAYASSKFAIEGLMQCVAEELKDTTIRTNSVNPGATRTAMRAHVYPQETVTDNPLPEQIMPVYLYLLGPDSIGVNGQALNAQ